jgi:hypothetical protein
MDVRQPGKGAHFHVVDVTAFKQLLGLLLAQFFFCPVEINLACQLKFVA